MQNFQYYFFRNREEGEVYANRLLEGQEFILRGLGARSLMENPPPNLPLYDHTKGDVGEKSVWYYDGCAVENGYQAIREMYPSNPFGLFWTKIHTTREIESDPLFIEFTKFYGMEPKPELVAR